MRLVKRTLCILLALTLVSFCALPVLANSDATSVAYSYIYDAWGDAHESPNPFTPVRSITGGEIGAGNFRNPQDLFERDGYAYIVDTGNNRIVVCNADWELERVIDSFMIDGERSELRSPHGIFVTEGGEIYIADTENQRIIHADADLNIIKVITKPHDALMDDIAEFLPLKIEVDDADRIFLLARNINKGIMVFSGDGVFTGFIGANKVRFDLLDMIWKRIFSTREQREQMIRFVPTEFSNIAIDDKGFIYTTCSNLGGGDIMRLLNRDDGFLATLFGYGDAADIEPISRLNAMGADVLVRNGWTTPVGDLMWDDVGTTIKGPSQLIDIVPTANDCYFALDRIRGRVFAYDFQGNLLYVFGGYGNKLGYFTSPTAIEFKGENLLVLDSRSAAVTVFVPTEFGMLIDQALTEYKLGNYQASADLWEQVLVYNVNFDLAYIGIGRALLRQDRFEEAMEYFKLKYDFDNYSKAFQQYRKLVVERNMPFIVSGIIILIVGNMIYKRRHWIKRLYSWIGSNRRRGDPAWSPAGGHTGPPLQNDKDTKG